MKILAGGIHTEDAVEFRKRPKDAVRAPSEL